jgi:hypothetical protein
LIICDGAKKTRRSICAGCACIYSWLKQFLDSSVSDDQNTGIWLRPVENAYHQKGFVAELFLPVASMVRIETFIADTVQKSLLKLSIT